MSQSRRVDVGDVVLVWGDRTEWNAKLRDERLREHLARPVAERLLAALDLVIPGPR